MSIETFDLIFDIICYSIVIIGTILGILDARKSNESVLKKFLKVLLYFIVSYGIAAAIYLGAAIILAIFKLIVAESYHCGLGFALLAALCGGGGIIIIILEKK